MRAVRLALYFVLGLMLGGVTVTAFAATGPSRYGSSVNFNYPNGLNIRHRSPPRYDFDSAPDGWGHMRDINGMSIGGRDVDINGVRKFAPGNLAALAKGLARIGGPLGIGMTLAPLVWDEVQGWLEPLPVSSASVFPTRDFSSDCQALAASWESSGRQNVTIKSCYQSNNLKIAAQIAWDWATGGSSGTTATRHVAQLCPFGGTAFHQFTQPAHPLFAYAGTLQTSYNGCSGLPSCPSGTVRVATGECLAEPSRPVDDQTLEDAIYAELVARGMGSELARRLIEAGYTPEPQEITADGPTTIDGGTTTTTSSDPSGITTTTTTTEYDLSYSPGPGGEIGTGHATVGIIRRTETIKTNPDGSIESRTNTDAPPSGGGSTQPEAEPEPPPDVCEQNPDASGCAPLGDPQDDQQVETEQRNIGMLDYATVNGTCPQPLTFSVAGYSHEISYQFICDGAVALRPLVIALGMLGAGLFMFGTLGSRKF